MHIPLLYFLSWCTIAWVGEYQQILKRGRDLLLQCIRIQDVHRGGVASAHWARYSGGKKALTGQPCQLGKSCRLLRGELPSGSLLFIDMVDVSLVFAAKTRSRKWDFCTLFVFVTLQRRLGTDDCTTDTDSGYHSDSVFIVGCLARFCYHLYCYACTFVIDARLLINGGLH